MANDVIRTINAATENRAVDNKLLVTSASGLNIDTAGDIVAKIKD